MTSETTVCSSSVESALEVLLPQALRSIAAERAMAEAVYRFLFICFIVISILSRGAFEFFSASVSRV